MVNGEEQTVVSGLTLLDFLILHEIDEKKVAVELNREIVPRGTYGGRTLKENDSLEIVYFVGGG